MNKVNFTNISKTVSHILGKVKLSKCAECNKIYDLEIFDNYNIVLSCPDKHCMITIKKQAQTDSNYYWNQDGWCIYSHKYIIDKGVYIISEDYYEVSHLAIEDQLNNISLSRLYNLNNKAEIKAAKKEIKLLNVFK